MKYFITIITIAIMLSGCKHPEQEKTPETKDFLIDVKYCIDACINSRLGSFHNEESQGLGGASSSSMGVSSNASTSVFTEVQQYCKAFYQDTKCYRSDGWGVETRFISDVHGDQYGPLDPIDYEKAKSRGWVK